MAFVLDDILISVALSAISAAISYAAAPKPEDSTANLNDVPLAQDGQVIKMVFGRFSIKGINTLGYGDRSKHGIILNGGK